MSEKIYYKAPSNKIFNEVKKESISLWNTYDDTYGYASSKINKIKDLENIRDNFMCMVAMFDYLNQKKLIIKLSENANDALYLRLMSGGNDSLAKFVWMWQQDRIGSTLNINLMSGFDKKKEKTN